MKGRSRSQEPSTTPTATNRGTAFSSKMCIRDRWAAYLIACFQPVTVWLSCSAWFTELGLTAVLPWQETIAAGLNLLLWGGRALLALRRFDRKDVS